jgi:hypothetical protein
MTNYKIAIKDDLKDYLKNKNIEVISLSISESGGGCYPTIQVYEITHTKPDNENDHVNHHIDGLELFIDKNAVVSESGITFSLGTIIKNVVVEGLILDGE